MNDEFILDDPLFARIDSLPAAPAVPSRITDRAFPNSVDRLSIYEISEAMQAAAALLSWAESLMSEVEARYIGISERMAHIVEIETVKFKENNTEEVKKYKTVASLKAHVIESNDMLRTMEMDRVRLRSNKHRLEHMLVSYSVARDTLSRQIEVKKLEQGSR